MWNLHPLKSPGPDGFPCNFYKHYWHIVKDKLTYFVVECFQCQRVPERLNRTFIVLILKIDKACDFNHFQPISLCNFAYKVVAKILANLLSIVIDKLIFSNQGAIIKGRWIEENIVIAQEVVIWVKKHKGNK